MKRRDRWLWLLLAGLTLISVAAVSFEPLGVLGLDRWIFGGGESARAGGALTINATVGQPVAALSASGPLTLYWGYWGPGTYYLYLPLVVKGS